MGPTATSLKTTTHQTSTPNLPLKHLTPNNTHSTTTPHTKQPEPDHHFPRCGTTTHTHTDKAWTTIRARSPSRITSRQWSPGEGAPSGAPRRASASGATGLSPDTQRRLDAIRCLIAQQQ